MVGCGPGGEVGAGSVVVGTFEGAGGVWVGIVAVGVVVGTGVVCPNDTALFTEASKKKKGRLRCESGRIETGRMTILLE